MSEVKYKDSGIEWIGQIPEDWKLKKLRECITTKGGKFIEYRYWTNGKYDVIGANGKVGTYDSYNIDENCILMGRVGTTGNPRLSTGKSWITHNCLIIRTFEDVDMHWVLYLLSSLDYDGIITKTVQPMLSATKLTSKKVPYPPLPEQIKIANYLDRVISNLDRQIEINEQLSCKYKELKKSEIYECVTKGLPESRARRGYKDSGIEWIGEIPEDWSITRVNYIIDNKKGMFMGPFGSTYTYITSNDGEVPVFSQTNITNKSWNIVKRYVSNDDYNKMSKYHIKPNYLYLTTMGSVGYCMQGDSIKGLMDSHYIAVKLDNNLFNDKYFYYCYDRDCGKMGYDGLGKELHGATMDGINSKLLKKLRLPVPPIQVQQEIATYLDKKCTIYDSLTKLYQAKADKLKELKKSMIYEYVTGKKRVK